MILFFLMVKLKQNQNIINFCKGKIKKKLKMREKNIFHINKVSTTNINPKLTYSESILQLHCQFILFFFSHKLQFRGCVQILQGCRTAVSH